MDILVFGDSGVGKTSLVQQFMLKKIADSSRVGKDLYQFASKGHCFTIFDCPGEFVWLYGRDVPFRPILRRVPAVLLVFDVNKQDTFYGLSEWLTRLAKSCDRETYLVVVGTQQDLMHKDRVNDDVVREWCAAHGLNYFPASALTGEDVVEIFENIVDHIKPPVNQLKSSCLLL